MADFEVVDGWNGKMLEDETLAATWCIEQTLTRPGADGLDHMSDEGLASTRLLHNGKGFEEPFPKNKYLPDPNNTSNPESKGVLQWQVLPDDEVAGLSQKKVIRGLCCYCHMVEPAFHCTSKGCSCNICIWCNIDSDEEECGCHYVPTKVEAQLRQAALDTVNDTNKKVMVKQCLDKSSTPSQKFHELVLGVTPPVVIACASCRRPVGSEAHHCSECGVTRCWWCIRAGFFCACGDPWGEDHIDAS
jgi:hypothetical protein